MPISHKQKFIFIHIPKTGGDSVEDCLDLNRNNDLFGFEDSNGNRYSIKDGLNLQEKKRLICLQHLTALQIKKKIDKNIWEDYYKFTFIRNPWDKIVSHYFYIIQKRKDLQKILKINKKNTFRDYVYIIGKTKRVSQQKNYIFDDQNKNIIDFVGRFENLEKDFQKVCDKIKVKAVLKKTNISTHKNYKEYYTSETRNIVKNLFNDDIELFKYKF